MATVDQTIGEQRLLLYAIDWKIYEGIGELLRDRHIRLTYDGGTLEFMTTSPEHERFKKLMARMLEAVTLEVGIEIAGFGGMTFKREDLDKGMEPDECYWIQSEPHVRCKDVIDLETDPPPDLIIEVEVSRSLMNRLDILAGIGIPEVWRFDGEAIHILHLRADRVYTEAAASLALPFLPVQELVRFFDMRGDLAENELLRTFRTWVREQIAAGWPDAPPATAPGKKKKPRKNR